MALFDNHNQRRAVVRASAKAADAEGRAVHTASSAQPCPPAAATDASPSLLEQSLIAPNMGIRAVIQHLDSNDTKIALVVDDRRILLGTITDGDLRRAILRGLPLDAPATEVMNPQPTVMPFGQDRSEVLAYLQRHSLKHLPLVDFANRAVDLITLDELLLPRIRDNWVVLMAGGKGMRLRPLTENTPKPMLDVGGRPILETIIRRCTAAGFNKFFLSVNFHADVIKDHFGDGHNLGATIEYIEEDEPLGTAGPLTLLPDIGTAPLVVMNGDILTKVDPGQVVAYHQENNAMATMAVREYEFQVPYGVIDLDNSQISSIREKPLERYFINAGIYTLDPAAIAHLPATGAFDMPNLFDRLRIAGHKTLAYPIREYWVDIGQMDDYQRANVEFPQIF